MQVFTKLEHLMTVLANTNVQVWSCKSTGVLYNWCITACVFHSVVALIREVTQ